MLEENVKNKKERQTDRQTDRQTNKQTDRKITLKADKQQHQSKDCQKRM